MFDVRDVGNLPLYFLKSHAGTAVEGSSWQDGQCVDSGAGAEYREKNRVAFQDIVTLKI